jgi:hypothetical protein
MSKKKKKNYFDNELVEKLIMEYKAMPEGLEREDHGNLIMKHVNEIVGYFAYNFSRFEERDDLYQHASEACFKSIKNFNPLHPKYSSAFNWFSLTAKRALLNYTLRKKKHRGHQDIDEFFHLEYRKKELDTKYIEDEFCNKVVDVVDKNFFGQQRVNYIRITLVLTNYLSKRRKFKKTDFYAWARSHGFTNANCREFIRDIGNFFEEIVTDTLED